MLPYKKIYVEIEFLEELLKKRPDFSALEIDRNYRWWSIWKMIQNLEVNLNIDYQRYCIIIAQEDSFIGTFLHKKKNSEFGLNLLGETFPNLRAADPLKNEDEKNSIFLTTRGEDRCLLLSRYYNNLILNVDMLLDSPSAFIDNGVTTPSDSAVNWDFLDKLTEWSPNSCICNTIIIADNYIIKKAEKSIRLNLKPIFNHLFPKSPTNSRKRIDINVYTLMETRGESWYGKQNIFINQVKQIRPDLDIHVTVYKVEPKEFHDRAIITNNLYFDCGRGFDELLFPTKGEEVPSTKISILYPFIQQAGNNYNDRYIRVIEDALKIDSRIHKENINFWGDSEQKCYLLDYYRQKNKPVLRKKEVKPLDSLFRNISVPLNSGRVLINQITPE